MLLKIVHDARRKRATPKSYLWILARSPAMNEDIKYTLIEKAAVLGFDTSKLIHVDHHEWLKSAN